MATIASPTRHLLRAKDMVDARYRDPLDVPALARVAHVSPAHFSREFRRAFGLTPHQYLLTRRLERAGGALRNTDYSVAEVCLAVGLRSVARSPRASAAPTASPHRLPRRVTRPPPGTPACPRACCRHGRGPPPQF